MTTLLDHSGPIKVNQEFISSILGCFSSGLNLGIENLHCWKKKRDFQIIRSKVGRLVTRSVADNEYFICWKDKMVYKYHQK